MLNQDDLNFSSSLTETPDQSATNGIDEFISLESLIKNYASRIEELQKELKEKSQMLKDAFENDAVYREKDTKAKEASKERAAVKKEIFKRPELVDLQERIKEIKFDIAEHTAVLSDYLQQYSQKTGSNQIELGNGEIMEIVTVTKLVRRASVKEE